MADDSKKNVQVKHPHLPFIIGAVVFLVYALTLNHGVGLRGLPLMAQMTGWTWQPMSAHPLLKLVCAPLQLIPAPWLPVALNLVSALTAAMTLAVLARSVQLLPLNRLRIQRMFVRNSLGLFSRRDAWVPAVMAVVTGGLELGFWQEATSASGEMLDVLLLAVSVWCLLEYRQTRQYPWLDRASVVWGIGMAENWTMQLSLPLFLGALFWLRGLNEVRTRFIYRMAGLLLAAFSTVILLSLSGSLLPHVGGTSGPTFAESLAGLRQSFFSAQIGFWESHPLFTLLVLLYFLLAALPMSLHLKREGSYHVSLQARVQLLIFEYLYGFCLLAGLWLALGPNGGPTEMMARYYGSSSPLLSLCYINALGVGYYTAHFLLIFGADWESIRRHDQRFRPPPYMPERLRYILPPLLHVLPLVMLIALAVRNFNTIEQVNRTPLEQYGELAAKMLPTGGGILLSEDDQRLWVLQAALVKRPDHDRWILINADWLARPEYRTALEHHYPLAWPQTNPDALLTDRQVAALLYQLAATNRIYYFHPSFGHFVEGLRAEPHGLAFRLTQPEGPPNGRAISSADILQENKTFWDQTVATDLQLEEKFTATIPKRPFRLRARQLLSLPPSRSSQSRLLGIWYSVALDDWGAWLQTAGQSAAARQRFEQALALYPQNPAAIIHLSENTNLGGMDVSIPLEMIFPLDESAKSLPRPMNQNLFNQRLNDVMSIPRDGH